MLKSVITGVKGLLSVAKANPHITLAGAAVVGVVGVAVSGYISGKKACTMLEAERIAKGEELTKKEKVKIIAKCAWVTALIAVLTGGAIIGSTYIANKHIKKLAIAYASASAMLEAHQAAEIAKLGTDVVEDIKKEVAEQIDLPDKTPLNTTTSSDSRDYLFFDDFSGRYFYSTVDKVDKAFAMACKEMYTSIDNTAGLNVLYENLGLDHCGCGNYWGWDLECDNDRIVDYIPYELYTREAPGGEPCQVLVYHPREIAPF